MATAGTINSVSKSIDNLTSSLRQMQKEISSTVSSNSGMTGSFNNVKASVDSITTKVQAVAKSINNAVNYVIGAIRKILDITRTVFNGAINIINGFKNTVTKIISLFGNLGNRIRQAFSNIKNSFGNASDGSNSTNNSFNLLKGTAVELKSKIELLAMAFDQLFNNKFVEKALTLYQSIYSFKNIVGHDLTQATLDWANTMERAFGISARELISDLNELSGTLYGLGISAKDVPEASENILMMSRYLAFMGAAGGDANEVMQKFQSGIQGMTRAVASLGLSVRDVTMDEYLKKLKAMGGEYDNIATDFSKLNEEQKVYVRYAALVDQFNRHYDMSNFVQALDTTTGRISILKQNLNSLATMIGQVFTEIFGRIANYITFIVQLIQKAVQSIVSTINGLVSAIFGIENFINIGLSADTNKPLSDAEDAVGGLNDSLEDTEKNLDNVEQAAKRVNKSILGFDKVTKLNKNNSNDSGVADGFDYSSLMSSAIGSINELAVSSDDFFNRLKNNFDDALNKLRQFINDLAKWITGRPDFDLGFDWNAIRDNLYTIKNNIISLIGKWGTFFITIGLKIADDVNIGLIVTKITGLIAKLTELLNIITDVLQPALINFYDKALSPIVQWIGVTIAEAIDLCIDEFDKWGKWFQQNKEPIYNFFNDLADIVETIWNTIKPYLNLIKNKISSIISLIGVSIRNTFEAGMAGLNKNKSGIIDWIETEIPKAIDKAIEKTREFIKWLGMAFDVLDGMPTLDTLLYMGENEGTLNVGILQILQGIGSVVSSLIPIIADLAKVAGNFIKNELLPFIGDKLKQLGEWLDTHKQQIEDLLSKVAGLAWNGFKKFVDLVGKLIDFGVNHPGVVTTLLGGMLAMKVGSWAADWATGLAGMIGQLSILKKLGGIQAALGGFSGAGATGAATVGVDFATLGEGFGASAGAAAGAGIGAFAALAAAIVIVIGAIADLLTISERFKDMWSTLGDSISKQWEGLTSHFTKMGEDGSKITPLIDKLKESFDRLALALEPVLTILTSLVGGMLAGVINLLGGVVDFICNELTGAFDILAGIADIIIGAFTFDKDKILQGFRELGLGIVEIIGGIVEGFLDAAGALGTAIFTAFEGIGTGLIDGFEKGIADAWIGFMSWIDEKWQAIIESVKDFFGIHSPSTVFADIGKNLILGLQEGIKAVWDTFIQFIVGKLDGLKTSIVDKFDNIKTSAVNTWNNVKELFKEKADTIGEAFSNMKENVSAKFTEAKTAATNAWSDAKTVFSGVANNVCKGFESIKTGISKIFTEAKNNANNILSGIKTTFNLGVNTQVQASNKSTSNTNISAFAGYRAGGGKIPNGSVIVGNEGGNIEMYGKLSGGMTVAANNQMITDAIYRAVRSAVADGTPANARGMGDLVIKNEGLAIYDESTLRQLARMLKQYLQE